MLKIIHKLGQFSVLLSFFILCQFSESSAQTSRIEELLTQLDKNSSDTAQIRILRRLSAAYTSVDPIKKMIYANQYMQLAKKNGIDSTIADGYIDIGTSYGVRSKYDSALYYFKKGLEISLEINYGVGTARSYNNIGFVYDRTDKKKEAILSYKESLKILNKLKNKRLANQCIINIGSIYYDLKEYKLAHNYFLQALDNHKEIKNDEMGYASVLYSLAGTYRRLNNISKSMSLYEESLSIRTKLGDINGIALCNMGIGQLYNDKKEFKKALPYFDIALKNNIAIKNSYQESAVLLGMSTSYLGLKNNDKAEELVKIALAKGNEVKSQNIVSAALEKLIEINTARKNFEEALKLQAEYNHLNDSLNTDRIKKEVIINDLNRVNTDNRNLEKDNQKISKQISEYSSVIIIISILLIILIVISILYYKRNLEKKENNIQLQNQKQEIAKINEELSSLNEELITQMEIVSQQNMELEKLNQVKNKFFSLVSHDLRSPMNSLKSLFELFREGNLNKKELDALTVRLEENIYHTASFLDNLLEWSKSQLDGIKVQPETVVISDLVNENIKLIDSQIQSKDITVTNLIPKEIIAIVDPNMINIVVRNLLSNAIKFSNKGGNIKFSSEERPGSITWTIQDEGRGISESDQKNLFKLSHQISTGTSGEKGYHLGLILCNDMISQNKGTISVESKLNEGTKFTITLPKSLNS